MRFYPVRLSLLAAIIVICAGCAHPIVITPNLSTVDFKDSAKINRVVGYFISDADRGKEVTTPGGGGDSIRYFPYRDLEPGIQKVLLNIFADVLKMPLANDQSFITKNKISFVFIPEFGTSSSSSGVLTWPPTDFSISLNCKAFDENGALIWQKVIRHDGAATFDEFKNDFALSGKRAGENVFIDLHKEINAEPAFKR